MLNQDLTNEICLLNGNDVALMLNISRAFAYQLMRQGEPQSGSATPCECVRKICLHTSIRTAGVSDSLIKNGQSDESRKLPNRWTLFTRTDLLS